MNPKSALLAFALFFACLTLTAQETIVAFSSDTAASVSVAYTLVSTARFDTATPLSAGAFERMSPRSSAVAGRVDLLLNTVASGATPSFVTAGVDLADRSTDDDAAGTQRAMPSAPVNPEPATYAWMALGLGAIGFSRRRRQSRAD
jgi:PEP-CTERM motif